MPRFYLDLKRHRDTAAAGETPWTPAVAVMYQVDEGLRLMQAEGDGVYTRHAACQAMTRAGLRAIGFELLAADDIASKTVTAARVPEGVDWSAFNKALKARGLVVAGGQGKLKGHIFRLGHLGSVTTDEILAAIGVLEAVAIEQGLDVKPGAAVAAAQQALIVAPAVAVPA
jgi:aspartate aminotransferase-like enzyme